LDFPIRPNPDQIGWNVPMLLSVAPVRSLALGMGNSISSTAWSSSLGVYPNIRRAQRLTEC